LASEGEYHSEGQRAKSKERGAKNKGKKERANSSETKNNYGLFLCQRGKEKEGLRQFQTDIAATEHDQVRGCVVQLQCFDMRERARFRKAGDARYRTYAETLRDPVEISRAWSIWRLT